LNAAAIWVKARPAAPDGNEAVLDGVLSLVGAVTEDACEPERSYAVTVVQFRERAGVVGLDATHEFFIAGGCNDGVGAHEVVRFALNGNLRVGSNLGSQRMPPAVTAPTSA
jgi:hypothetical protein